MTCILFDCDGVLIDSEYLHAKVEVDFLKEIYGWDDTPQNHNKKYAGMGLHEFYREIEALSGEPLPKDFAKNLAIKRQALFETELRPIQGVRELLETLKHPACVASNTPKPFLDFCLQKTGLYDCFAPHIYSAVDLGRSKPAPDVFIHAAWLMGFKSAKDCIVIEDSTPGVMAAHAAGMHVIGFTGGSHCTPGYAEDKLSEADQIIASMSDLKAFLNTLDIDQFRPKTRICARNTEARPGAES